jgi:hypothetical protein
MRVLGFAGTVDDAAHHSDIHFLDTGIRVFPDGHLLAQIGLNAIREFLKYGRRRASATGTSDHHRRKFAQAHGLQDLLCDDDFTGTVTTRLWCERNTYGVTDAFLQQDGQSSSRCNDTLAAHACLGETKVQRVITSFGEFAVNRDQVLHARDLAGQCDSIPGQAEFFGTLRVLQRRSYQSLGSVDGVDIDEQAIASANDNARRNHCEIHFFLPEEFKAVRPTTRYDLVMANILSSPLKLMAPMLCGRVAHGGALVLSGVLARQADEVIASYAPFIALSVSAELDGWVALAGHRPD